MIQAVDLFAGVGWSFAVRELGIDELGIDLDANVCAVRRELGMRTLQADIAALNPLDFSPCQLLIASPPCTAFSTAGKGKGRDALGAYATQMQHMARGWSIDRESQCDDATAHLVLEPLRWALALEPSLITCEQVPKYPRSRSTSAMPWVSMAEALSWGMNDRPALAISHAGQDGGSGARKAIERERGRGAWVPAREGCGNDPPTVLFGHQSNDVRWYDRRTNSRGPGGTVVRTAAVPDSSPAPTITPNASGRDTWVSERPSTTVNGDPRISEPGRHDPNVSGSQQANSIRVTVEEAAVLQSFPVPELTDAMKAAGISKTASFRLIGNAYPPLMAKVTLVALLATLGDK